MNEKKQKKIFLTIISIIVLILAILLIKYFNAIACHFYGVTSQANGQLLGTVLTAIGGSAVIYGLYLNNRRIKEQNRQNNIADKTNNDKRFGDAIGYLNSDNEGVAIGGIYALYQLAKEDKRYIPIVMNLYCNYLRDKSKKMSLEYCMDNEIDDHLYPKSIIQVIIDNLFKGGLFQGVKMDLSGIIFLNLNFKYCITDCSFNNNSFINCTFESDIIRVSIRGEIISKCRFNCKLLKAELYFNEVIDTTFYYKGEGIFISESVLSVYRMSGVRIAGGGIANNNIAVKDISNVNFLIGNSSMDTFNFGRCESVSFNKTTFTYNTEMKINKRVDYSQCKWVKLKLK
jgi:hypothetical protein